MKVTANICIFSKDFIIEFYAFSRTICMKSRVNLKCNETAETLPFNYYIILC